MTLDIGGVFVFQQKEEETSQLKQDMKVLQTQKQELLVTPSPGDSCIKNLKEKIWKLECSALEQGKIQNQQENTIEQLQQVGPYPERFLAPASPV